MAYKEDDSVPDYTSMMAGMTFSTTEVLGKPLENPIQYKAFQNLANQFFGSEQLFENFKEFIRDYWETELAAISALSSNG